MSTPITHLGELNACESAVAWVKSTKCRSLEAAWRKCERGDWMLWYAGKKSGPVGDERRKKLVLAACECARLALPIWEKRYPDDKRVRDCIETAEKWARNEATLEALQVSRRNCYSAATSAATSAASSAAYSATSAASSAATSAAYAAAYAAYAAAAAYAARAAYAAYAARAADAAQSADLRPAVSYAYAYASAYASDQVAFLTGLIDEYDRLTGRTDHRTVTPAELSMLASSI